MHPHAPAASHTVHPVESRRDLKQFIDLPYTMYRDAPAWVPPLRRDVQKTLNPKKNPFFEHGQIQPFLATDATGRVVGRVAAIVNGMHLKKYDDGIGFFGFFDCEDDAGTATALLDAASDWLRRQGLTGVRGPVNPSLNDTAGLLVDGFDRQPSLLMPYNAPYYEGLLLQYGFERVMTMWAYYLHYKHVNTAKLRRGAALIHRRNPDLTVRPLNMKRFDEEVRIVRDIYNEAWSDNWGHVPMTEAEFAHLAADLKQIVDPNLVFFLEKDSEPVAFSISLPNFNQALKHVTDGQLFPLGLPKLLAYATFGGVYEVRMPLMGVRKAYHGRAFDVLPILATMESGLKEGYTACEMSWVLDTNKVLLNLLADLGGVVDKEYALYEKTL